MKVRAFFLASITCGITAILLLTCQSLVNPEAGTARVTAMLYNPGGSPAVNAKVCFFPNDYNPQTGQGSGSSDSTETDADGNYTITLDSGTYNILANGDSGLAFQDSIRVAHGSKVHPPACTLRTPGTIGGVVELEQGGDPRSVIVLFMGTRTFTTADADGNFVSEPMAGGKYRVRILTTLPDYEIMDTGFVVRAGRDSVIPEPLVLKYTGIPTPENLVVSYDTLNETVMLSWDLPDTALISGYNIYRSIKGYNFSLVTPMPLAETQAVFYDTGLTVGNVYEYRVVSRTQAGEESKLIDFDADTALVVSRSMVTTTFSWNAIDRASIYDTVPVRVNFSNPTRRINQLEWYLDTAQMPARTKNYSSLSGNDTLVYFCSSQAGLARLIVKATDNAGTVWRDTFNLQVIQDAPVANAGNDTTVGRGDTVHLKGIKSTDRFGRIVKYEWDIGSMGNFIECLTGDTNIFVSDSVLSYLFRCVLRVRDDDNCTGLDTVMIDIKVEGVFTEATSSAAFMERAGHSSVVFNQKMWVIGGGDCNRQVVYNDVWSSTDGIYWNLETPSADFPARQFHSSVVFENKIWVIGGENMAGTTFNDVWYSTDGVHWILAGNADFSPRSCHTAVVFNGKIWIINGGGSKFFHADNDIWNSINGFTWIKASDSAFPGRVYHSSVVFEGKIWIMGGKQKDGLILKDVWFSNDGTTWTMANNPVCSKGWFGNAGVVYNNKIWIFGIDNGGVIGPDLWNTQNGISWIEKIDSTAFANRGFHSAVVYDNKIWSIGGFKNERVCYPLNNIWYLK
jgi:dihydrofolate reductase